MPRGKKFTAQQIIGKLREAEVELARACLAIVASRKLTSQNFVERLSELVLREGVPHHTCSANGSEFTAKRVREWPKRVGAKTLAIEPGAPRENGHMRTSTAGCGTSSCCPLSDLP